MALLLACGLDTSDWIEIISILINAALAFWIGKTLQNSMNNKRVLKDHFINEVHKLKENYFNLINNIISNTSKPKDLTKDFKALNIQATSTLSFLNRKYNIDTRYLSSYQIELKKIITELDEFVYNFRENDPMILENDSLLLITKFQQKNIGVFNNLIIDINDN